MSFTVFSLRAAAVPGFCQNQGSGGTKTDRQPDRQIKVAKFWLSKSKKKIHLPLLLGEVAMTMSLCVY